MSAAGRSMLVTGGAGFIGSHLCDSLLDDGYDVRVIDDLSTGKRVNLDERITLIEGDITRQDIVRTATRGVDGIFHLAAIASVARSNEDWPGTHRVNQTGTVIMLDAARRASRGSGPIPVVFASSASVYGDTQGMIATEDMAPTPLTAYGADKLGSELHARVASMVHLVPTLGLRFFNVYGRRQDPDSPYSGVISIFAKRIAAGQGILLHGDGGQTRDFVHVKDVVAHLRASMDHLQAGGPSMILNVCGGVPTSIASLAQIIADKSGRLLAAQHVTARLGDIRYSCGDPTQSQRILGVRATIVLSEGLSDLL